MKLTQIRTYRTYYALCTEEIDFVVKKTAIPIIRYTCTTYVPTLSRASTGCSRHYCLYGMYGMVVCIRVASPSLMKGQADWANGRGPHFPNTVATWTSHLLPLFWRVLWPTLYSGQLRVICEWPGSHRAAQLLRSTPHLPFSLSKTSEPLSPNSKGTMHHNRPKYMCNKVLKKLKKLSQFCYWP